MLRLLPRYKHSQDGARRVFCCLRPIRARAIAFFEIKSGCNRRLFSASVSMNIPNALTAEEKHLRALFERVRNAVRQDCAPICHRTFRFAHFCSVVRTRSDKRAARHSARVLMRRPIG